MPFPIHFSCSNPELSQIELNPAEMFFVLGANGVGKSSLLLRFSEQNRNKVVKISAHRQTWMSSDALDMTPKQKLQTEQSLKQRQHNKESRYKDDYGSARASMTIYDLIDAENVRAREIAAKIDAGRVDEAKELAKNLAPLAVINELLQLSSIPIEISIQANERVMASKNGSPPYSAAELSDGERNALLIAGAVLTAPPDTLIIVDEPERHLHRSIISPLLTQLFKRRQDCAFVISTHDHDLPLENPLARTLLVRSCQFNGGNVQSWDADLLSSGIAIGDELKKDLLGSRQKILFVEGVESSLDRPLYSQVFPQVSVIPKGSCREVEQSVQGLRTGEHFHWLKAFGIVDGDGSDFETIQQKSETGVYAVPYYSVEAIYFHPKLMEALAGIQSEVTGDDKDDLFVAAQNAGFREIERNLEHLCKKAVKKLVQKSIVDQLPDGDCLLSDIDVHLVVDSQKLMGERKETVASAIASNDWETVLQICPIRECGARESISKALKFISYAEYQKAVLQLLLRDETALQFVRSLFLDLFEKLEIQIG